MTMLLSEEQQLFRDSARRFLRSKAPVATLRRLRDSNDATGFSRELWRETVEMGWAGVLVPEEQGGVSFGLAGAGLLAEEVGRTLTPLPLLTTAVLAVTALMRGGSVAQRKEYLPAIATGALLFALAVDERPRHAPDDIRTRATVDGDGFRLNGDKTFVLDGHVADTLIVVARTSGSNEGRTGISLFLVPRTAPGVTVRRTIMIDSRNSADVGLLDVRVSSAQVLGSIDGGMALLDGVLDAGRAFLAAELVGLAAECLDRTLDYLRQREQFGRKVGEFQALQHRAAHLFCEIELARSAVRGALRALDTGAADAPLFVSVAKAKAGEIARLAANEALQMHGGIGMTDEFDLGFFVKRARAAAETFGDYAFHGDRVARIYGF